MVPIGPTGTLQVGVKIDKIYQGGGWRISHPVLTKYANSDVFLPHSVD